MRDVLSTRVTEGRPRFQKIVQDRKGVEEEGRGRNEEFLICWKNWPKKYDSWVKSSEIEEL